jgi:uncharacterized membrane protein YeaQ/YmgE (transglycosylase-associated protein family)
MLTLGALVAWIAAGAAAGLVSGHVRPDEFGTADHVVVGAIGGLIGGAGVALAVPGDTGLVGSVFVALIGGVVLLLMLRVVGASRMLTPPPPPPSDP